MYSKEQLRTLVSGMYDIQHLRIATGNRVVASMRPSLMEKMKDMKDSEKDAILADILKEYHRITDYFVSEYKGQGRIDKVFTHMSGLEFIKSKVDYEIVSTYVDLRSSEERLAKQVERVVKEHPMWERFFEGVRGCGPLMAGVCLAYLDPYKANYCSSFWKYVGVDVVWSEKNERWEGRAKWHTEEREYTDREGNTKKKNGITYNPIVKTKLVGVLSGSFLKAGGKYADIYRNYRHRLECRPDLQKEAPAHIHRMASRYAVKMFLQDLWKSWREYEGLPTPDPYREGKLGMPPHHES